MKNFMIKTATVYEGVRKTDGQKYHWVNAELFDYEHPNLQKQTPDVMPIIREEEALKFLDFATEVTNTNDRRLQARTGVKVFEFKFESVAKALADAKAAIKAYKENGTPIPQGTKCIMQTMKYDMMTGEIETDYMIDAFFMKPNVDFPVKQLTAPWVRVASRLMTVTVNGVQKAIQPGEPIPGKTGAIVPVTSIRVPMQRGADGEFIEDLDQTVNRILEQHYKPYNTTPATAPTGQPAQEVTPQPDAETQAQAEAAAAALGGLGL